MPCATVSCLKFLIHSNLSALENNGIELHGNQRSTGSIRFVYMRFRCFLYLLTVYSDALLQVYLTSGGYSSSFSSSLLP